MEFGPLDDPLQILVRFREHAEAEGLPLPESMVLSTVGLDGSPDARVVFWRGLEGRKLHFFTNYESRKGRELEASGRAHLLFHYAAHERQVRVTGSVSRLTAEQSDAYFEARARPSQIGAWASLQSQPLEARAALEDRVREFEKRFEGVPVPRPPHWGGYGVLAESVEVWVGQVGRLHDRAVYSARADGGWDFQRLYP